MEFFRQRVDGPFHSSQENGGTDRSSRHLPLLTGNVRECGFTLIELIVVLMLAGILAAVAIPKFQNVGVFTTLGFYDRAQAIFRFAQKEAVAKRRNVCVDFPSGSTTLVVTYASSAGSFSACDTSLTLPESSNANSATASSGVAFTPSPSITRVTFNALGQASSAASFTVSDSDPSNTRTFSVEAATGYVHP